MRGQQSPDFPGFDARQKRAAGYRVGTTIQKHVQNDAGLQKCAEPVAHKYFFTR